MFAPDFFLAIFHLYADNYIASYYIPLNHSYSGTGLHITTYILFLCTRFLTSLTVRRFRQKYDRLSSPPRVAMVTTRARMTAVSTYYAKPASAVCYRVASRSSSIQKQTHVSRPAAWRRHTSANAGCKSAAHGVSRLTFSRMLSLTHRIRIFIYFARGAFRIV